MAYQQFTGDGCWIDLAETVKFGILSNGLVNTLLIDATGEKAAMVGQVWWPSRTGTKDISRVGFRFGAVTKAGGSALTVSLQNVTAAAGPPGQPDETQDQTVAIANADASFVSNTWYRTGALSANRTVSFGELLAVVVEYDGGGRLGADSVAIQSIQGAQTSVLARSQGQCSLKTGGSWATAARLPNIALEFSDGTFGTLQGGLPILPAGSAAYNSGSTPDEYAMAFSLPFACKIDGLRVVMQTAGNSSDFDIILYQGTTALQTVSVDANTMPASADARTVEVVIPETTIAANTTYYIAVKPTTTNSVTVFYADVDTANHYTCWPGGTTFNYATRTDSGSWSATTTRRLFAAIRLSSLDDGAAASDYPAVGDVQSGVAYGSGLYTGTLALPAVGDVQSGVGYGASGTEFTGTFAVPSASDVRLGVGYGASSTEFTGTYVASCDYPDPDSVRRGVVYGVGVYTGELVLPAEGDVRQGVLYGEDGTELTGTYVCADPFATGEAITLDALTGDDIDHDTLAAVEAAWAASTLSQYFSHPPQSGRLKADKERPQTTPYAHIASELESREPWSAAAGVVTWMDRRKVTITVYGTREECRRAIAAVLSVFNIQVRLTYPSGARFYRWRSQDGNTVRQDETSKAGQDIWQAAVTARVDSVREA